MSSVRFIYWNLGYIYIYRLNLSLIALCIMPTLISKKKKRTSIEYDSDGLIIPYHRKYGITRKKKVTDPFALPQACLKSPSAINHKKSNVEYSQSCNEDEDRDVIFNLDNMSDSSFSEDEVIPPTVSNIPGVKCDNEISLEFGNNSVGTLDVWHDDHNSIQSYIEMDVENEEVQPLVLCTEINNTVEFDEDMDITAMDDFNSDLKTFLDNTCDAMREDWEGELIFPAFIGNIFKEKCYILQFVGDINKKYSPFEVSFCNEN